jgi:L-arabinose isomerase
MNTVSDAQIDALMDEYKSKYDLSKITSSEDIETVRYQAREEIAIERILVREGAWAYTNTFEDLPGMRQLPGLASQHLMSKGYGFGAEGDWKTAAMTAILKAMDPGGATAFMEDYTYDYKNGLILGSHMLEVCPSVAADKPKIEVHPLGIGGKEPPARLVFEGKAGKAIAVSLIDMGGRMRLIVQDVECVKPSQTMPNLPVARVMWKPLPDLKTSAECWLMAGGAHHTVLTYALDADIIRDFARVMKIEFVNINENTVPHELEKELMIGDVIWG